MRKYIVFFAALFLAGCNRAAPVQPPVPVNKDKVVEGEEISKNPFKAIDQVGKLADKMAALQKEIEAMKPVDPVPFDKLLPLLPAAPAGYKGEEPTGETVEFGEFKHSMVERRYAMDEGKTVSVKIHDAANISAFYAAVAAWSMLKREGTDGYEKGVTIDGNPGVEKYQKATQTGQLTVMVAKRHLVDIEANGVPQDFVRKVYGSMDLKKLSSLK